MTAAWPQPAGPAAPAPDEAELCLHAVANELARRGFPVTGLVWGDTCQCEITGAAGGRCEMDLMGAGTLVWEYIPTAGALTPGEAARLALVLLGAAHPGQEVAPVWYPGMALTGAAGRTLAACGMSVRLMVTRDDINYEIDADVEVTNPAQPARGNVRISDKGEVRWECAFATPTAPTAGLAPRDIAHAIATALSGHTTAP